jgi:hypothetical protein
MTTSLKTTITEDHDLQKWQEQIDRHNREHPNDPIHGGVI